MIELSLNPTNEGTITSLDIQFTNVSKTPDKNVYDLAYCTDADAEYARALNTVFKVYGSDPILGGGIDWTSFLVRDKSFADLDADIRESLARLIGPGKYLSIYKIEDDQLQISLMKTYHGVV